MTMTAPDLTPYRPDPLQALRIRIARHRREARAALNAGHMVALAHHEKAIDQLLDQYSAQLKESK